MDTRSLYQISKFIISLGLSVIFFLQTFTSISIVPIGHAAQILGVPQGAIRIFLMMFVAFGFFLIKDLLILIQGYSSTDKLRVHNLTQYFKAFLLVWVTFFSYGILQAFGIIQKEVLDDQILNWYIFWLFFAHFLGTILYYLLKRSNIPITYGVAGHEHKWPK